jgi:hypothetical protein
MAEAAKNTYTKAKIMAQETAMYVRDSLSSIGGKNRYMIDTVAGTKYLQSGQAKYKNLKNAVVQEIKTNNPTKLNWYTGKMEPMQKGPRLAAGGSEGNLNLTNTNQNQGVYGESVNVTQPISNASSASGTSGLKPQLQSQLSLRTSSTPTEQPIAFGENVPVSTSPSNSPQVARRQIGNNIKTVTNKLQSQFNATPEPSAQRNSITRELSQNIKPLEIVSNPQNRGTQPLLELPITNQPSTINPAFENMSPGVLKPTPKIGLSVAGNPNINMAELLSNRTAPKRARNPKNRVNNTQSTNQQSQKTSSLDNNYSNMADFYANGL